MIHGYLPPHTNNTYNGIARVLVMGSEEPISLAKKLFFFLTVIHGYLPPPTNMYKRHS